MEFKILILKDRSLNVKYENEISADIEFNEEIENEKRHFILNEQCNKDIKYKFLNVKWSMIMEKLMIIKFIEKSIKPIICKNLLIKEKIKMSNKF